MVNSAETALSVWRSWRTGTGSDAGSVLSQAESLASRPLVVLLSANQYDRWQRGDRVTAEEYFEQYPQLRHDDDAACASGDKPKIIIRD